MKIGQRHIRGKILLDADKLATLDTTIKIEEYDKKFVPLKH